MKLDKLLEKLDYTLDAGDLSTEVASLEYDSRKVGKGSLFVFADFQRACNGD